MLLKCFKAVFSIIHLFYQLHFLLSLFVLLGQSLIITYIIYMGNPKAALRSTEIKFFLVWFQLVHFKCCLKTKRLIPVVPSHLPVSAN